MNLRIRVRGALATFEWIFWEFFVLTDTIVLERTTYKHGHGHWVIISAGVSMAVVLTIQWIFKCLELSRPLER